MIGTTLRGKARNSQAVWCDTGGASAVEFAIVCPVLLIITTAILVYGLYFGTAHSVQQLAADAARASIAGLSDSERSSIAQSHVSATANSYPLVYAEKITVLAGPVEGDSHQFAVTLEYDASDLPIFSFDAFIPMPSRQIRRTSTIRRGGY